MEFDASQQIPIKCQEMDNCTSLSSSILLLKLQLKEQICVPLFMLI